MLYARYTIANRKGKCQTIKRSRIPRSCTHESVTMNTVIQIKQCNQSYWLYHWLRIAGMQTGWHWLSQIAWVGGIWPALAAIKSDQHTCLSTGQHQCHADCQHVIDWSQLQRWRDGGRTYVLTGVCCMVWTQKLVRNNRGYVISKYALTDKFCTEKWRDRKEGYGITKDTL